MNGKRKHKYFCKEFQITSWTQQRSLTKLISKNKITKPSHTYARREREKKYEMSSIYHLKVMNETVSNKFIIYYSDETF